MPQYLSEKEVFALQDLSKNKDIVIQKFGQGNFAVIVAKMDFLDQMESFSSDASKFQKIGLNDDIFLSIFVKQEKRVDNI